MADAAAAAAEAAKEGSTRIFVVGADGIHHAVWVELAHSIPLVKRKIHGLNGVPAWQQTLTWEGSPISYGTLASHGVREDASLHLIINTTAPEKPWSHVDADAKQEAWIQAEVMFSVSADSKGCHGHNMKY